MKLSPDFGIVGYTGRWQYRPGEAVTLHLSADEPCEAAVRLHRFRRMAPADGALDIECDPVEGAGLTCRVAPQQTVIGSWFEAKLGALDGGFTLGLLAMPTALSAGGNGLAAVAIGDVVLSLALDGAGHPVLAAQAGEGDLIGGTAPFRLTLARWVELVLGFDPARQVLRLIVREGDEVRSFALALPSRAADGPATLRLAATRVGADARHASFDGRIEAPILWRGDMTDDRALAGLATHAGGDLPNPADLVAAWDFSRAIESAVAPDVGPHGRDGRLFNLPTRAVKGSRWSGGEQSWRHAPRDYAAIHFHRDDLLDAGWPVAARLELPAELRSGVYLIEIAGAAGRETLPILVRPKAPRAPLAFLASTFTWLAYTNDRCLLHGANPEMFANRLLVLTAGDCKLAAHPEYGLSLYDTHADGSGVSYASRRRPCLTLRHVQRAWQGALGSSLWNFSADLLILSWLEREGIAFDIVTDDDLDRDGADALAPYRCVMTGSHPEYHTARSHDAVGGFLKAGGRLIYLGGNGFYWRVSTHGDYPETIELRRAEDGNRSWASEPGEYYHAFDGAYGGLWRRNGRAPQTLVGVGYSGQGFYRCHPYRLLPGASDPRAAFLFGKAPRAGSPLGAFGLSGGGAAGIEIDRADPALGTPAHALVLATSDRLDDSYILANEEVLVNRPTVTGNMSPLLRCDLVFYETPAGGAVLSTGSVAWAGTLGDPRPDNDVADLTLRAVERFLDPAPFTVPPGVSA